jgi:hypothetical protein
MRFKTPSPAMLVALLALFVALGGTSYSAISLSKNSVGSRQIINGGVKRADIARNAVASAKVRDFSLLAKDFKAGQLPQGPQGPKGEQGLQGAPGEPGSARAYALIGSNGSANRAKNVTGVSHPVTGIYCFDLPFTPDNAVATGARPGPGNFSLKALVTTGVAPDLGTMNCVAPFTDAVAAVTDSGDATAFTDLSFFIAFN